MIGKAWRGSALTIGAALLTAGFAKAADDDTIRLGRIAPDDASIQRADLRSDNDAEIMTVRGGGGGGGGGRGGGGGGGYRGGGGFGGYGGRGYGGYGGYGGRGYGGYGGYGRGYGGWGYGGWGYGGFWGGYGLGLGLGYGYPYYGGYYNPYYSVPYYTTPYYYGTNFYSNNTTYNTSPMVVLTTTPYSQRIMPRIEDNNVLPTPRLINPDGSYKYDGGPAETVPMPMQEASPKATTDRFVSMPAPAEKKYSYAAYGEKPGPKLVPTEDFRSIVVK